jgi:hypothetical protein
MKPTRSACALRRPKSSTSIAAMPTRWARIRRTASGCSAPAAGTLVAGGQNLPQHRQGQGGGLRTGRPWVRRTPCSGPWISRCAGFHARSLNRCILSNADSRRRIVVGAWLSARLARCADGLRRSGNGNGSVRRAPVRKMRPVRLVGAQRGCGRGLFNQRLRRGKRRQARRCQRLGGGRVGRRRSVDLP